MAGRPPMNQGMAGRPPMPNTQTSPLGAAPPFQQQPQIGQPGMPMGGARPAQPQTMPRPMQPSGQMPAQGYAGPPQMGARPPQMGAPSVSYQPPVMRPPNQGIPQPGMNPGFPGGVPNRPQQPAPPSGMVPGGPMGGGPGGVQPPVGVAPPRPGGPSVPMGGPRMAMGGPQAPAAMGNGPQPSMRPQFPPGGGANIAAPPPSQHPQQHQAPPGSGYGAAPAPAPVQPGGLQPARQMLPPQFGHSAGQNGGVDARGMGGGAPMMGGGKYGAGTEAVLGQFQSLTMASGPVAPGQPTEVGVDAANFPRPVGANVDAMFEHQGAGQRDSLSCDPRFIRLSVNALPNSAELKKRWCLPLSALVQPLAPTEKEIPVVNFGAAGIVRCRQCRTYINSYVQFTDGGRRWKCNVCGTFNEVPVEYFCTTDAAGIRRDLAERPELNSGTVEYVAPAEYMVRPPMPPTYVFAFDVSYPSVASGMLQSAIEAVRGCLDSLPGGERTQVALLTYDSTIHFYNMRQDASAPHMLVVPDASNPYLPQPDDLLVNLQESREQIGTTLDIISRSFAKTQETEGSLTGAVQAAYLVAQHVGGKVLLFQASIPTVGEGEIRLKDDLSAYDTDKECALRMPTHPFFKRFGGECNRLQLCIDIFCCPPKYTDAASLSTLSSCSGGQFYFFPGFFAKRDGGKLNQEVRRNLTRETGWEAVMRVRMGRGMRCTAFHGHFMIRSNDLMALPTVDPDKAMLVDIGYEDQVVASQMMYMQCALLYTTSSGERRIRVHTLALPVVSDVGELFKACDGCTTAAVLAKLAAEKIRSTTVKETIQILNKKTTDILKEYRLLYSTHLHPHNKLILPESMRLLPLLMLGLQKSGLLKSPGEVTTDERSNVVYQMISMPFSSTMKVLYPRCYPLLPVEQPASEGGSVLPATLQLASSSIKDNSVYLLDNGLAMVIWIGRSVSPQWVADVFGCGPNPSHQELLNLQMQAPQTNETSKRVFAILGELRRASIYHQHCVTVRQGDPTEAQLLPWLIEDKLQAMYSYTNYLGYIHKGVLSRNS